MDIIELLKHKYANSINSLCLQFLTQLASRAHVFTVVPAWILQIQQMWPSVQMAINAFVLRDSMVLIVKVSTPMTRNFLVLTKSPKLLTNLLTSW